jgi:hypothetical protein
MLLLYRLSSPPKFFHYLPQLFFGILPSESHAFGFGCEEGVGKVLSSAPHSENIIYDVFVIFPKSN